MYYCEEIDYWINSDCCGLCEFRHDCEVRHDDDANDDE